MDLVIGRFALRHGTADAWDAAFRHRAADGREHPGWLGVTVAHPEGAELERVVIGRWRNQADYRSWTATPGFQRSASEMEALQGAAPDVMWHRIVFELAWDEAGGR